MGLYVSTDPAPNHRLPSHPVLKSTPPGYGHTTKWLSQQTTLARKPIHPGTNTGPVGLFAEPALPAKHETRFMDAFRR